MTKEVDNRLQGSGRQAGRGQLPGRTAPLETAVSRGPSQLPVFSLCGVCQAEATAQPAPFWKVQTVQVMGGKGEYDSLSPHHQVRLVRRSPVIEASYMAGMDSAPREEGDERGHMTVEALPGRGV